MHESNFLVDTEGNICILDFEDVGLLPESFVSYTMSSDDPFVEMVVKCLDWPTSPNLHSMARIRAILNTSSNTTFGTLTYT